MDHKKKLLANQKSSQEKIIGKPKIKLISYFAWSNIFLDINIEYIGTYLIIDNMFHRTHLWKPLEKKKKKKLLETQWCR